jgi:hypothetical protein
MEHFEIKDTRGKDNYDILKKDKWNRQISELQPDMLKINKKEFEDNEVTQKPAPIRLGRADADAIANPTNHHPRFRSESPPPKAKRGRKGCNKGHANACSFCRPEICKRMEAEADIKRHVRNEMSFPSIDD